MQLLEVKNDTAKIAYNPAENYLLPADFLLIEDENQRLVAQVTGFEAAQNKNGIVTARMSLSIDKDDNISYYNGYIPSTEAKVIYLNSEEISELIEGTGEKIFLGSLANKSDCFVKPDIAFLDDKLYIRSDNEDNTHVLTENLLYQTEAKNKRALIFDFDGSYTEIKKAKHLKISENFKLPLNINAFDTILEYDTKECPIADKAVIQSIVLELREYLKTLEDGFIPFTAFKNVIDSEFEENQIPGLMLLKNKLYLYAQDNVFADKKEEFDISDDAFFNNNIVIIDASLIEEKWYKFVVQSVIERLSMKTYIFLSMNEINADKKFLTALYKNNYLIPVISTSYNSKYAQILSQNSKNYILCKPQNPVTDNKPYSSLLNKINDEEFIAYGSATYRLPLLLNYKAFGEDIAEEIIQNEIKKDVDKFFVSSKGVLASDNINITEINNSTIAKKSDNDFTDDDLDFLDEENGDTPVETKNREGNSDWNDDWNDEWKDEWQDLPAGNNDRVFELMPVESENSENSDLITENEPEKQDFEEDEQTPDQDELDLMFEENSEEEIIKTDEELIPESVSNEQEEEIVFEKEEIIEEEDDCVIIPEEEEARNEEEEISYIEDKSADDDIVIQEEENEDTVLANVIEDIEKKNENGGITIEEEQEEETPLQIIEEEPEEAEEEELLPPEINEDITTNEVPDVKVYETDVPDGVADEDTEFKIGDRVYHPKHGFGVIEGFANYSNKIMFCQIEFENVGRRILDPKVSNLQKAEA